MNSIFYQLIESLPAYGSGLLFALAILETCFVTGLVVPSGLATSAATVFALEGRMELAPLVAAALAGGAIGDSLGFWIGRAWGTHLLARGGRFGKLLGRHRETVNDLFGRHPVYSVTFARMISFARTLMPMAAGMSGLSYRTFLPYELIGLLGWCAMYVSIGLLARESWRVATRVVGVGGTVVFLSACLVAWIVVKAREVPASSTEAS